MGIVANALYFCESAVAALPPDMKTVEAGTTEVHLLHNRLMECEQFCAENGLEQ